MNKEKIKVYIYTRVSTVMQIDGYSLDAQKAKMRAFAEYNDYEIVREYEDAGKSGRSIEGRIQFRQMIEDIKNDKDGISYVLVYKLSRFGRNAADVLNTLQIMQDYGVNLICVEDGIDSSKDAGKLIISVLSAVAEIEKDNIRIQTMEGRMQKAREGKWNGGFAPYGYSLQDGKLYINETEAEAIRTIFDKYVNSDMGANALARYLANHGVGKIERQNGKNPLFNAGLLKRILRNPVYMGKIAYGRRKLKKVHGTRDEYQRVQDSDYILVDGLHEAIVSEELWNEAQQKLDKQAKKYEHLHTNKNERVHLLSGIIKCPICGVGMCGNKSRKKKKDGSQYKDYYFYGCKHHKKTRGHECEFSKQINEEVIDSAVEEVIKTLVSNPKFAELMKNKINIKVDTSDLDAELEALNKKLKHNIMLQDRILSDIDDLDFEDKHYERLKADLNKRLYKSYDTAEELEELIDIALKKKSAIERNKITTDNIYKVLVDFGKVYEVMDQLERRKLMESLIEEIQIHEEKTAEGQWLKAIRFRLPINPEGDSDGLDDAKPPECVVLMSRVKD